MPLKDFPAHKKPRKNQPPTYKELRNEYGMSPKTFRKRLLEHGIDFKLKRVLTPNDIKLVHEALGPPDGDFGRY